MPAGPHDLLELAMDGLFRRRGVLDPSRVVPGLGASLSESLALGYLATGACCSTSSARIWAWRRAPSAGWWQA